MKRYILLLLCTLWVCSFYSCSDDPVLDNPLAGGNLDPTVTTPGVVVDPNDGSIVRVSWGGNQFALEFSYRYKAITDAWPAWSDWSSINEISIPYLNEGNYIFEVKSRLEADIESLSSSFQFEINAVFGPALRFYPLYKKVSVSSQFTMEIYAEDVAALTGAEIEFTYDPDYIAFNSASEGDILTASNNITNLL